MYHKKGIPIINLHLAYLKKEKIEKKAKKR
jgi:hypothetical protein